MVTGMKVFEFSVFGEQTHRVVPIIAMVLLATGPSHLVAGLGPENVAVVVNVDSNSSTQIGDAYVRLRNIPVSNVIRLPGVPDSESIEVDDFRSKLLGPVLEEITRRGLSNQIECIAWSSDFPTAINVKSDIGQRQLHKMLTPVASLNGLTYLYQLVMRKDVRYLSLQVNGYARRPLTRNPVDELAEADIRRYSEAMQAATGDKKWAEAEETLRSLLKTYPRHSELHYNLACCLANSGRLDDAVAALRDAAASGWWNRRHAERDDDLQAIRGRDDFQKVLDKIDEQTLSIHASRGFRGSQGWGPDGKPVESGGFRYVLSTVLAVTRGRGTTVDESIAYLRRSVSADNTHPKGTIYYLRNGNIRSTSRDGLFPSAVAKLTAGGVQAQIVDGTLPKEKTDVQGVMVGAASFDWKSSGRTIQP
ncbi:MAG: tetratricopeptide repeat protein, partial [Planctomycetota bacterium]|nr:tetratricopeptide repeat protein [Planctomycetota bacterium]